MKPILNTIVSFFVGSLIAFSLSWYLYYMTKDARTVRVIVFTVARHYCNANEGLSEIRRNIFNRASYTFKCNNGAMFFDNVFPNQPAALKDNS